MFSASINIDKIRILFIYSPFIPLHAINLYKSMCEECQLRRRGQFKGVVVRPILSSFFNSRGHVDLVDMQSMPDGLSSVLLKV